jgi:hypothetical protein
VLSGDREYYPAADIDRVVADTFEIFRDYQEIDRLIGAVGAGGELIDNFGF